MKKLLLETSFSKIYILVVMLITLLILGGYFSYAMFTISKEKGNAISILTGNLSYELLVDGKEDNSLVVDSGSSKTFVVTLNNPNNIKSRFNFYYIGDLPLEISTGYIEDDGFNITPLEVGIVLEKANTSGSSNVYKIRITNKSNDSFTLNLGVRVGLDYNDLDLPDDGHLFTKYNDSFIDNILEYNQVQQIKGSMFNYTSDGIKYGAGAADVNYITNGVYKAIDVDGESYYFRGKVNNNVQFGEYTSDYYVYEGNNHGFYQSEENCRSDNNSYCTSIKLASSGDKMYWKIIRVNGNGNLRLIYNGTNLNSDYDSSNPTTWKFVGINSYNNLGNTDIKYTGYTYDNNVDTLIKKEVDLWYKNTLSSGDYDAKIVEEKFCSDSSNYHYDSIYNYNVFASYDRVNQYMKNFAIDNTPTLICPATSETYGGEYTLKVGLITVDELVFGGESAAVSNTGYLSTTGYLYWTMSPADISVNSAGVWTGGDLLTGDNISTIYRAVRPVINLDGNLSFSDGDGSLENPFKLS